MNPVCFSRPRFLLRGAALTLLISACLGSFASARAPQITLEQGAPPQRTQNQPGLSPDKKRSLSRLGPDEVFPTREQNNAPNRTNRTAPPKPRPAIKPTPALAPTLRPTPNEASIATPTPTPVLAAPTVAPTVVPVALNTLPSALPAAPNKSTTWQFPVVLGATFAVFVAFVGVLYRLRRKLREDRNA